MPAKTMRAVRCKGFGGRHRLVQDMPAPVPGHLAPFTNATALDLMASDLIDGDACVTHAPLLDAFEAALTRRRDPEKLHRTVARAPKV